MILNSYDFNNLIVWTQLPSSHDHLYLISTNDMILKFWWLIAILGSCFKNMTTKPTKTSLTFRTLCCLRLQRMLAKDKIVIYGRVDELNVILGFMLIRVQGLSFVGKRVILFRIRASEFIFGCISPCRMRICIYNQ